MTAPDATPTAARSVSVRTQVEYDRDWALFADWCAAADLTPLPANPDTIASFMTECPAAPATQRRRAAAVDWRHLAAGFSPPTDEPAVRFALGRPELATAPPINAGTLAAALRMLPSHGWTVGLFGRRDRALLVLAAAGIDSRQLAAALAGNLTVGEGAATFTNGSAVTTFQRHEDPVICVPCAIARWLRLLRLIATHDSHRWTINELHRSPEVTPTSPHQCVRPVVLDNVTAAAPLLPRIDQWGYLDTVLAPVQPRSLSSLSQALFDGRPAVHRFVPPPAEPEPAAEPAPATRSVGGAGVYTRERWKEALERRRLQNQQAADIDRLLADLEARTRKAAMRIGEVLA